MKKPTIALRFALYKNIRREALDTAGSFREVPPAF
jgi:hypothetical protein